MSDSPVVNQRFYHTRRPAAGGAPPGARRTARAVHAAVLLVCLQARAEPPANAGAFAREDGNPEAVLARGLVSPVYVCQEAARPVQIDGYLSEWQGIPAIPVGTPGPTGAREDSALADLSGQIQLQWDRQALYLGAEIRDDRHLQRHADGFLDRDDSLMLAIDALGDGVGPGSDANDWVYALASSWAGDVVHRYEAPAFARDRDPANVHCACRRLGDRTRYECAFPWAELAPLLPLAQSACRFSLGVNDRDREGGREPDRWTWTGGMGSPRDPRQFGTMILAPTRQSVPGSLEVYAALRRPDLDGDEELRLALAFRSPTTRRVRVDTAVVVTDTQIASRSDTLDVPEGPSRYVWRYPARDLPAGAGRLIVTVYETYPWAVERLEWPLLRFDSAARLARLSEGKRRAPADGAAGQAALDARLWLEAAEALLVESERKGVTLEALDSVDRMMAKAEALLAPGDERAALPGRQVGWVVHGYRSPVDDSLQPYLMRVPDDYDATQVYPLVVVLHYFDPELTKPRFVARQIERVLSPAPTPLPLRPSVLELHPFGRGNTWYRGLGELDVLHALDAAKALYAIDPDRVYLTGGSMGGTGTWYLASRHPELFAAVAPICGHMEYAYEDEREFGDPIDPQWPRSFWQAGSPYFLAANLYGLPVNCHQGRQDTIVPAFQSQAVVRRLREMQYPIAYEEYPTTGHSGFPWDLDERIRLWMLNHRRDPCPQRVVLRTSSLEHCQSHWLRIDRLDRMYQWAQLQGEFVDREARLSAWGVREFTLTVPTCRAPAGARLRVHIMRTPVWDGERPVSGELTFRRDGPGGPGWHHAPEGPLWRQPQAPLLKRPGLQGPLQDAYRGRFVSVYGTAAGDATTALLRTEAQAEVAAVNRWYEAAFLAVPDADVTQGMLADANLILYGGPKENRVVERIAGQLPIRVESGAIAVGDRRVVGASVATRFIYPNPLHPSRHVVVTMGVVPTALRGVSNLPWGPWSPLPDYLVFEPGDGVVPRLLVEGMFDDEWQVDLASPLVVWRVPPG